MILDFLNIAANLKTVPRQGWVDKLSIKNPESVADHTYSMAIIGMVLSDSQKYNTEKILKMILLHDLAEDMIWMISSLGLIMREVGQIKHLKSELQI